MVRDTEHGNQRRSARGLRGHSTLIQRLQSLPDFASEIAGVRLFFWALESTPLRVLFSCELPPRTYVWPRALRLVLGRSKNLDVRDHRARFRLFDHELELARTHH